MYAVLLITIMFVLGAIRELCEARDYRDSGVPQFVDATQLNGMIDILCTK